MPRHILSLSRSTPKSAKAQEMDAHLHSKPPNKVRRSWPKSVGVSLHHPERRDRLLRQPQGVELPYHFSMVKLLNAELAVLPVDNEQGNVGLRFKRCVGNEDAVSSVSDCPGLRTGCTHF